MRALTLFVEGRNHHRFQYCYAGQQVTPVVIRNTILIALLFTPLLHAANEPVGRPDAGEALWHEGTRCYNCHGENGEGAFAPDLAGGRGLTWEQFKRPIRKPWGVMPAYADTQVSDQDIADIYAFLKSRPPVPQPGEWRFIPASPTAPLGQRLYMQTIGCGQCHEQENTYGRIKLGEVAKDVTFDYFANLVYSHTDRFPKGRMGSYSRDRLPEQTLREIYKWTVEDLGMRASLTAALAVGERAGDRTTYTLTVKNNGVKGKGLAAEGLTVFVKVPKSAKVLAGSGTGYVGAMPLAKLGLAPALSRPPLMHANDASGERPTPDLSGDVVVWKAPRLSAADKLELSLTLSGLLTPALLEEFRGSTVHWDNPGRRPAGKPPVMVYRDIQLPDVGDHVRISVPRMPQQPTSHP